MKKIEKFFDLSKKSFLPKKNFELSEISLSLNKILKSK